MDSITVFIIIIAVIALVISVIAMVLPFIVSKQGPQGDSGQNGSTGPTGPAGKPSTSDNYLYAFDNTTQSSSTTFQNVTFGTVQIVNGWSKTGDNGFKCVQSGNYIITYRLQVVFNLTDTTTTSCNSMLMVSNKMILGSSCVAQTNTNTITQLSTAVMCSLTQGDIIYLQWQASDANTVTLGGLGDDFVSAIISIERLT